MTDRELKFNPDDVVIKSEFFYDDHADTMHHKTSQPTEDLILSRNRELRRNEGAILDFGSQSKGQGGSWGHQVASIPFVTWEWAKRNGFDLDCPDSEIREKELFRFLQFTDEGRVCKVTNERLL